jgi:hypothetical protein
MSYLIGRTSIAAEAMRPLFVKLQFEELPEHFVPRETLLVT